jgi:hypothetical protein
MRVAHIFFVTTASLSVAVFVFLIYYVEAFSEFSGRIVLGIAVLCVLGFIYFFAISNEKELLRISKITTFSEQIKSLFFGK